MGCCSAPLLENTSMSITYETISPRRTRTRLAGWMRGLPLRLQIMCRGRSCRHHASTNNKLCPTRELIESMRMGNITGGGAESSVWHPRQTSYEEAGGAARLRLCKNPSAQVSAESIMDARAITINSQP